MLCCRSSSSPGLQFLTSQHNVLGLPQSRVKVLGALPTQGLGPSGQIWGWAGILGKFSRAVVSPGGRMAFIYLQCGTGEG